MKPRRFIAEIAVVKFGNAVDNKRISNSGFKGESPEIHRQFLKQFTFFKFSVRNHQTNSRELAVSDPV